MNTKTKAPVVEILVGTKVVAPITDKDGEESHVIGLLTAINSRMATIELSDGSFVKVGKTKIEPMVEEKPAKIKKVKPAKVMPICDRCQSSEGVYNSKEQTLNGMTNQYWCQACDSSFGPTLLRKEETIINSSKYGYTKCKAASGRASCHNGDTVAEMLLGLTLNEVYAKVSLALQISQSSLEATYAHLNAGQQRMCLGNRLRKLLKVTKSTVNS